MKENIVAKLTGKDDKYACALADKIISESQETDEWYEYFDEFASLLNHPKSLVRNRALYILATNAQWDEENRFDLIISDFLAHITDEKPITARQCIKALAQVGSAKPQYIPVILSCLRSADLSKYKDSMRPLIEKDITETEKILTTQLPVYRAETIYHRRARRTDAEPIARLKYSSYQLFSFRRRFYYVTCHYANVIELVKKSLASTTEFSAYEYELSAHLVCHNNSYSSNAYVVLFCMGVCCNNPLLGRGGDEKMRYSKQFMEHIEYAFAAFCRIVLRNAAISAYRDFGRKQKHEVSLDYLISETLFEPSTTDNYFEQYDIPTVFVVKGQEIIIASERLADALLKLPEQRRTVLLMYFFLGYTDTEVRNEYGRSRSTANYWKHAALKQLRKEWLKSEHEKQEADTF